MKYSQQLIAEPLSLWYVVARVPSIRNLISSHVQRNVTRVQAVNTRSVDKLLEAHARIYVLGNGDAHAAADK